MYPPDPIAVGAWRGGNVLVVLGSTGVVAARYNIYLCIHLIPVQWVLLRGGHVLNGLGSGMAMEAKYYACIHLIPVQWVLLGAGLCCMGTELLQALQDVNTVMHNQHMTQVINVSRRHAMLHAPLHARRAAHYHRDGYIVGIEGIVGT
jgi:hypothetical protein